ncbi:DUF2778 domain-containing protein [Roseibium sp. SCPC15]|uniref:DUF2778 domain-containing protein n=1 Tax=Roseibium sp. SCP15 TaxID=3141376 RepID=UPI003336CB72
MLHSEQKINQESQKSFTIDHWPIYAILAAIAILIAGLALGMFKFVPKLVPGHFVAEAPSTETIELSFVRQDGLSLEAQHFTSNEDLSERTNQAQIAARLAEIERMQADIIARQEARSALAAQLAHQQLTRTILTAQTDTGLKLPRTDVANFAMAEPGLGTGTSDPIADETAPASVTGSESLANFAELSHPTPRTKPEAPRVTVAAKAEAKPGNPDTALGYAAAGNPEAEEGSVFSGIGKLFSGSNTGLPGRHRGIAVYDISAATVHMPDGTKLEAHSGIGHRKDNPKYAHVKNLGPTPPNVYDLRMRESLFHGVEAIRMTPRDVSAMKGRDGMLAHTPLLRRTNGSHGCVAFKDYKKFLKAFKAGKVKKMIVVPSMNDLPTYMAAL